MIEREALASAKTPVRRPPLRYYGGKWRLAPWIIEQLPPHTAYVEPCAGGAAVLLQKPPSPIEIYNDSDHSVTAFFRCLRDRPDELLRALELTPYAREELARCRIPDPDAGELEQARRLYVCCWQSFLSHARGAGGWRMQRETWRYNVTRACREYGNLRDCALRLAHVQIECDDVLAVIARYDTPHTLFYLDPPYLATTRRRPDHGYRHEMGAAAHEQLADALHRIRGMAAISGYRSSLYDQLFAGWERRERTAVDAAAQRRRECLWLSPSCARRQLSLGLEDLP
jgi:DNA adenine methylase